MRGAVTTRFAGGFVYDSPSGTFRRADLLVRDERIVGLEDPQAEPGAIDVEGLYFLPGLIDCHVHLGMRAEDADPAAVAARPDTDIARHKTAAALGKPVAAHAHATLGIRNATLAGVASIEHGTYAEDEVLHLMAERGTFLVPTLMASTAMLRDPVVRDAMPGHLRDRLTESQATHQDAVRRARRMDVPIAMGTDAGTPGNRHGANADELVAMVEEAGLSPRESIHAATLGAARLIRREGDLGSLELGHYADEIGLVGDPTRDIDHVTHVVFVMRGGRMVRDDARAPHPA